MQTRVKFESKKGFHLSGILHQPDVIDVQAYAILAHCFTCTKSLTAGQNIAETLSSNGIATLRFDFTGLGASKGQFAETSFSTNVDDLQSAAAFLTDNYAAPQIMVGHSLGGTAVLAAAANIGTVKAVATIGSPASPDHILHMLEDRLDDIASAEETTVTLAGREFKFKQCFVDDVRNYELDIGTLGKAIMVLHAPFDDTVPISEATKIFIAAKHPKSFMSLDKADHLLSRAEDSLYAGDVIASWAKRFIVLDANAKTSDPDGGVTVTGETSNGFYSIVQAGVHRFIADEPLSYGGTNKGPTPYDYLGAALGACTSMTLNGYARRKTMTVSQVSVNVSHTRIHAKDCDTCETSDGKVDQFTRVISIIGDITDAERKRMLEIADKCPVHRTLENEIRIVTKLSAL
ncbi:osmotically inducible protein C [Algimonas arctica]|uniref:Osmotically inducible protein C n=1 Tax=Algimonas arctica TaxID=1479486 RepID=A0A8J3CS70_9PROT|nr:bifunctional alpha/beta hydrolase/OsmC family protein [Algimonas arctica]GHB02132.1 osmotically inducible protein C [Algimonas arctica]